jgi:transcriptional regulator with XRE-family HTH domain
MSVPQSGFIPTWTLGDRLRKAREHAGLMQAELAAKIGISRASIINYETGRHIPSRPVLLSWALSCGVDLGWLAGEPPTGPAVPRTGRGVKNSVSCALAFAMAS